MADFISQQTDYILFLYALSHLIFATSCFVKKKPAGDNLPWHLLGFFGLLHGSHQLIALFGDFLESIAFIGVMNFLFEISSYLFLFEFGRKSLSILFIKTPGRIIYVALAVLVLLGWPAAKIYGIKAFTVFFVGFTGGVLTAAALVRAARRYASPFHFLVVATGIMMGLYALANLAFALPAAYKSFFPSSREILLRSIMFYFALLGVLLILVMAFAISLFSLLAAQPDPALHYFRTRSAHVLLISSFSMLLIISAGWTVTEYFADRARNELRATGNSHAETLESQLLSVTAIVNQDVMTLAESPEIIDALRKGRSSARSYAVINYYKWTRQEELCYFLDGSGNVVDSSNRKRPDSIVGRNFSGHPYVRQAMNGVTGHYFAVGLTTRNRGYISAFPIQGGPGKILGVAVIKKNLDALEVEFVRQRGYAFLISPEGVIFLSSHSEMNLMSLWPLKDQVIGRISRSRQFGPGPFTALLSEEPLEGQEVLFNKKNYFVTRRTIDPEGWSIVLLNSTDTVVVYRLLAIAITMSICILTISFFIVTEKSLEAVAKVSFSENRFRIVFEEAPGAIFIIDKHTRRILTANSFMSDWLGFSMEELLSLRIDDISVAVSSAGAEECLYRRKDGTKVTVEEKRKDTPFHGREAVLIIAHDVSDRKKAEEFLHALSTLDGLTGIANRRRFNEFIEQEWRRAMREKTPVSLVMCDIDNFKSYNDTYGHLAGDDCLRQVADVLGGILHRPGDLVARYGGEEFALIMSNTDMETAVLLAESLRIKVEQLSIAHNGAPGTSRVTMSLGVAAMIPPPGSQTSDLISAADKALYQAKKNGRNRTQTYSGA